MTTTSDRLAKVRSAWASAYDEINAVVTTCGLHLIDESLIGSVEKHAHGLFTRIEEAERDAETSSVEWTKGGPGGVSTKIKAWVDLWTEAVRMVADAR
jgi:hypothetical protein